MPDTIQEIFKKKIVPVTFERTIGLFGATTIGVGALMGAGVYVLIGLAAGAAGPSVWLSYIICGTLAFLTTLLYAELAKIVPAAGGGYAYAYDALGSIGGFITGWFLALGSIFACGLYAIGFAEYFTSILGYKVPGMGIKLLAILLVFGSTFLNTRGTKSGDHIQKILTWGNLLILVILILFSIPKLDPGQLTPMFPKGLSGTGSAIAIIYISFFGYQLIANNSDEIVEPTRTVPRAMVLAMGISLLVYLLISFVAIMVVPWQELASSNAPLIEVATRSFGSFGWVLISVGGIVASAGALNSTLLSQGRQIYAMGKNRFLPNILGKIHEAKKTPQAALYAGGILIVVVLLFLDLQFIAKSANFCLLISLLPVSLALRKIYRSNPEKRPKASWKRILPELTLVANIGLLFTLDWVSLVFGLQLCIAGGLVFFFYSRKREIRASVGMNLVLTENTKGKFMGRGDRVLVPVANPQTQHAIFSISNALLAREGGEIVTVSVVNTPKQMDFYSALSDADYSLDIIQRTSQMPRQNNVSIRPVLRASRSIPRGIVHAAEEENCNLIVMGYAGKNPEKSASMMQEVLHHANTDIIFFKLRNLEAEFKPKKIAVSLGGRVNLDLMVKLAGALATSFNGEITFLNILPVDFTPEQKAHTDKTLIEAIQKHQTKALYNVKVFSSEDPLETLVEKSGDYDLLIIGTTKVKLLERAVVGTFSTQIAERATCSVAVVRVVTTAKKLFRKI